MHDLRPRATVDSVVAQYCEDRRDLVTGRRRARVDATELALRRCFEDHADEVLTGVEQGLLGAERLFGKEGAPARVAEPDALLVVLPTFLLQPKWHGEDCVDRRLRSLTVWRIAHCIARLPEFVEVDLGTAMGAIEAAELDARRVIRRDRAGGARRALAERRDTSLRDLLEQVADGRPPLDEPPIAAIAELRRPFPARAWPQR